jgi:hypothetical protein
VILSAARGLDPERDADPGAGRLQRCAVAGGDAALAGLGGRGPDDAVDRGGVVAQAAGGSLNALGLLRLHRGGGAAPTCHWPVWEPRQHDIGSRRSRALAANACVPRALLSD